MVFARHKTHVKEHCPHSSDLLAGHANKIRPKESSSPKTHNPQISLYSYHNCRPEVKNNLWAWGLETGAATVEIAARFCELPAMTLKRVFCHCAEDSDKAISTSRSENLPTPNRRATLSGSVITYGWILESFWIP